MNNRPAEQVFSSELIYQVINAVRLFNSQVCSSRSALSKRLNYNTSDFYLIQRRWMDCNQKNKSDQQSWFDYSYYELSEFGESNHELVGNIIYGFDKFEEHWKTFFRYLDDHTSSKSIRDAENWISQNRDRLLRVVREEEGHIQRSDRRLLHHHLLQLYSRFPTRRYIHGGLYSKFISSASQQAQGVEVQDAQAAEAFYVFLHKHDKKSILYPPFSVWKLREGDECESQIKGEGQDQDVDGDEATASLEEQLSVKFFNQYLSPIFNEIKFNGQELFDVKESHISHMLWLPLFDEYADGRFHGFFRGWLFQVLLLPQEVEENSSAGDSPLLYGDAEFINKRYEALRKYVFDCLPFTHSLASDLNRAVMREITNQVTLEKPSYEILSNSMCLLGDWNNSTTRSILETTKDEFTKLGGFIGRDKPTTLSINLDPPFLERDSETFVSFEEINEDSTEEHRELFLEFGKDFRRPEGDASVYYNQLVNQIYLIFSRLKNAKWADIQSQKQGQLDEARAQVGRWAHALQTKLARLEEIFCIDGAASNIDRAVRINIEKSLRSLRQAITTLSYYQRVVDYLRANKTNLRELSLKPEQRFPGFTRNLGLMMLDAFSLMMAKVNLKEGRYSHIERKLPEFYKSCKAATALAFGRTDVKDQEGFVSELKAFFPSDRSVIFELEPSNITTLSDFAVWSDIPINTEQGEIKFNYAEAVSVVIDEILSNACKYVSVVDGKAGIQIKLSVEADSAGHWAIFEVTNTAAFQELHAELGEDRNLIDYEEKKTAKGQGLFFNRELCEMLVGEWEKNYTVKVAEDYQSVKARFRFPIGIITEKR